MIEFTESALTRYLDRLASLEDNPPADRHRTEILNFLEGFKEIADQMAMPGERRDRLASRILHRLHLALTSAEDPELRAFYYACMQVFGLTSLPYFLVRLRQARDEGAPVGGVLEEYPRLARLLAVNNILQSTDSVPAEFVNAAVRCLPEFSKLSQRQAADFLLAVSSGEETLAFAVEQALRSGPFWKAAMARLGSAPPAPEDSDAPKISDLIECLTLFEGPELVELFTGYLARRDAAPSRALLRALARMAHSDDVKVFKAVTKLLLHDDKDVQEQALLTLTAMSPKDVGRILAAVYKKNKTLKPLLVMLLPLMRAEESETFLASMSDNQHSQVLAETYAAWTALEPDKCLACLKSAAAKGGHSPEDAEALAAMVPRRDPAPGFREALEAAGAMKKACTGWEKKDGEAGYGYERGDLAVRKRKISDVNVAGSMVSCVYLANAEVVGADFSGAVVSDATFRNVVFTRAKFNSATLKDMHFLNCRFVRCSFVEAGFHDVLFEEADCEACSFEGATFSGCSVVKARALASVFAGAAFHGSQLLTSRLECCDFSRLRLEDTECRGVECIRSNLTHSTMRGVTWESSSLDGSLLAGVSISGIISDSPEILGLYRQGLLDDTQKVRPGSPPELTQAQSDLARDALEHWQILRQAAFRKMLFMRNNKRRIKWAREKMGAEKARFTKLVPYLLHTEVFEHVQDLPLLPLACCVAHYQPDLETLEIASDYFNRVELPEHAHDPVQIHGVYLIGSVGSVAQTAASDLDFWVCYDAEDMPDFMAEGLAYKLEVIEQWAMEVFGLEVHFFLMDVNLIRHNQFGFSDAESSGSAQALLLKEEFYRTAVHVAGRLPVWCVTEPGEKRNEHLEIINALLAGGALSGLIDLGGLKSIPKEEFFGASLWQIVKALKSPFKSIMKFGLLEKYIAASDSGHSMLLCDKLKANIFEGHTALDEADPYILLFKEVVEHYLARGDKDSLQMVRMSFALKAGLRNQMQKPEPFLRAEDKQIKAIFAGSGQKSPMHLSSFYTNPDLSFDELVSMGQKVNKFVIRTYARVREEQSGLEKVAITPEDLTKLGRKIFSTFSKRENKIEHIPFVSFSEVPFKVLHFSATGGNIGEPESWDIQGAQEVSKSQRLHLADLRSGKSLPELLAWLSANEIYAPGMPIRGDYSISPVTTRDLSICLNRLRSFFPASKTFNTDIAETLNPERVVRAFFLLNLVRPPESTQILDVSVIYSTNWGELFCVNISSSPKNIRKDPVDFLRAHLPQSVPEAPVMESFVPTRSNCQPLDFKAAS